MTQALYAHMNNKTIKKKFRKCQIDVMDTGTTKGGRHFP
jgi:hypothetical protein